MALLELRLQVFASDIRQSQRCITGGLTHTHRAALDAAHISVRIPCLKSSSGRRKTVSGAVKAESWSGASLSPIIPLNGPSFVAELGRLEGLLISGHLEECAKTIHMLADNGLVSKQMSKAVLGQFRALCTRLLTLGRHVECIELLTILKGLFPFFLLANSAYSGRATVVRI